jgi:hypothetical protein
VLELRVAGHDIIIAAHKEDDVVVAALVNGVHVINIAWEAVPKRAELHRVLPGTALLADPPEVFALESPHFAADHGHLKVNFVDFKSSLYFNHKAMSYQIPVSDIIYVTTFTERKNRFTSPFFYDKLSLTQVHIF